MFNALVSKAPAVRITLEDESVLVHPAVDLPGAGPASQAQDPIVRGTVLLELASARAVNKVKVVFEGLCDAFGGPGYAYETSTTLHNVLETDLGGEVLAKGSHALNFSFLVPSSTTCSQRCNYGRVRYYVKATVEFAGKLQPTVASAPVMVWVSANPNIPGEPLGTQIHMHHDSEDLGPVAVVISSPHLTIASLLNVRADFLAPTRTAKIISIQGVIDQQFTIHYDDPTLIATPPEEHHTLAKVGRSAKATPWSEPNATHAATTRAPTGAGVPAVSGVGGVASTSTSDPASASVSSSASSSSAASTPTAGSSAASSPALSLSSRLRRSPSPPTSKAKPPAGAGMKCRAASPSRERIKSKYPGVNGEVVIGDEKPLRRVEAGEEYAYSRVMRVPDDDFVRATTLEGSEGRIRVSHNLAVEIRYKVVGDEGGEKMLRLSKKLTITSCCCHADRVYLPSYSRSAPKTVVVPLDQRCFCNMSLQAMLDRDLEPLQRAGQISVAAEVSELALAVGADRENKSPAVGEIERWRAGGEGVGQSAGQREGKGA